MAKRCAFIPAPAHDLDPDLLSKRRLLPGSGSGSGVEQGSGNFHSRIEAFEVACSSRMDAELEKLVEAGKLTARQADRLQELKPGTFCLHKSWGFGRVAEWNLLLNQVLIDFPGKKAHPMQLSYAAENLTVIPPAHFLAKKATDLPRIKELVKKDPVALMRNVLESLGGSATVTQISQMVLGDIFTEPEWKRWWDSTKKLLNKEGYFFVPTKKRE